MPSLGVQTKTNAYQFVSAGKTKRTMIRCYGAAFPASYTAPDQSVLFIGRNGFVPGLVQSGHLAAPIPAQGDLLLFPGESIILDADSNWWAAGIADPNSTDGNVYFTFYDTNEGGLTSGDNGTLGEIDSFMQSAAASTLGLGYLAGGTAASPNSGPGVGAQGAWDIAYNGGHAYMSDIQNANIPNAAWTIIAFTSAPLWDGAWLGLPLPANYVRVPGGTYEISGQITWPPGTTGSRFIGVDYAPGNNAPIPPTHPRLAVTEIQNYPGNAGATVIQTIPPFKISLPQSPSPNNNANGYSLALYGYQSSGGALSMAGQGGGKTFFSVRRCGLV